MNKIIDGIFVVISAIAFVGGILLAYVLYVVGRAIGLISAGAGAIPGAETMMNTMNIMLLVGWVFVIVVLLSSAYAFWAGIGKLRAKKK